MGELINIFVKKNEKAESLKGEVLSFLENNNVGFCKEDISRIKRSVRILLDRQEIATLQRLNGLLKKLAVAWDLRTRRGMKRTDLPLKKSPTEAWREAMSKIDLLVEECLREKEDRFANKEN